jgi:potassium-transporting ATPase KdpC subunit
MDSNLEPQTSTLIDEERSSLATNMVRAILATIVLTVLVSVIYPAIVWGIGQVAFNHQANGSLISDAKGNVIGSELIGQQFTAPQYFHGRPSAASTSVYTGTNGVVSNITTSSGTNYGPTNASLISPITGTVAINAQNVLSEDLGINASLPLSASLPAVPIDLVTASASGLDPNITPAAAQIQVSRVAKARGLSEDQVRQLVDQYTEDRDLSIFGEPRVNVLKLNLSLDALKK